MKFSSQEIVAICLVLRRAVDAGRYGCDLEEAAVKSALQKMTNVNLLGMDLVVE